MSIHDGETNVLRAVLLKESGRQVPLFCIPGAGGDIDLFRDMASQMEWDHPVYGIDMRGFFEVDRKFTVEQLATACLSVISDTQHRGPYHMCGYSFGAIVAYEVANRLRSRGEDIGVLALIDTANPMFGKTLSSATAKELQRTYLSHRLGKYLRLLVKGNIRVLAGSVSALLAARAGIESRRVVRGVFRAMNRPMPEVFRNNDRALFEAWAAYNPPRSALPLLLFYGDYRRSEYGGDRTLGWSLATSGKVDVELASEGHVDMMKLPQVRGFALRLSSSLMGKIR